ncbi:hypothetical protein CLOSTASPAR_06030 [[Clostridium] asparagiforme DSM 15981]|uniref:Uncharacterized protein n=1 Tax=[Clostridium] asparagiforme DSM 15981 TaxID=518636 RepID=C0D9S9_9FIRM|nr:hypothetical protein CLOSTASPAR_06030 [[Clostridium] asparagiforme DSM 15981]
MFIGHFPLSHCVVFIHHSIELPFRQTDLPVSPVSPQKYPVFYPVFCYNY